MPVINGTDLTIYIPTEDTTTDSSTTTWTAVALAKSASLSLSLDTPDASTKDSSGWAEVIAGQKSWSMSFEGLVDYSLTDASGANVDGLYTYYVNRSKIKVAFGQDGYFWHGDGFINSLEQSAEMESPVSFSGGITGSGALTYVSDGVADIDSVAAYPV